MELIPSYDIIPVAAGWFEALRIPALLIHFLLINIMVGGSIIAFLNPRPNASETGLGKDMSDKLTYIISLAINFGVVTFLFLQVVYGQFIYVSSQMMAAWWLSVIVLLMIGYYAAYYCKFNFEKASGRNMVGMTAIIFLCIAFFFCNNMTLMLDPSSWTAYFDNPDGTLMNFRDTSLLPRYFHFIAASLAVGGLFVAIVWTLKKDHPHAKSNIERGMNWFVYATLAQIAIGFWFQMSLPKEITGLFLGAGQPHTAIFLISMVLAVSVLFLGIRRQVWASATLTVLLVFLMVLMRDMLRLAYLKPFFTPAGLEVHAQYSPMIFFAISLIAGTAAIVYVIRLAMKPSEA